MTQYKIVETDNFNGDYPDEQFVNLPLMNLAKAKVVAEAINKACSSTSHPRYWRVVEADYILQPGFEA